MTKKDFIDSKHLYCAADAEKHSKFAQPEKRSEIVAADLPLGSGTPGWPGTASL